VIRIVTDGGLNLPAALVEQHAITVIAGHVDFGDGSIPDYPMPSAAEFYRRLAAADQLPTTRDSTIRDFRELYTGVLARWPDSQILSIHVSEVLATTITMARQAAALLPMATIRIFDSKSVSLGQGLLVYEAARLVRDGRSMTETLERLGRVRDRVKVYFLVDTLDYLAKGGRVGSASRVMGTLLNVKPVLEMRDGSVEPHSQHRTRARGIAALHDLAISAAAGQRGLVLGVAHAVAEDDANQLAEDLKKRLKPDEVIVTEIGPAVGTHAGPGALAVGLYGKG
jgi:DegV family protein with EDD domain